MIQSVFGQWHAEEIDVHVNIMQPTRQTRLSLGGHSGWGVDVATTLQITSWAGDYSGVERALEWQPGEGAVGHAYADGEIHAGTRRQAVDAWETAWDMNPQQMTATQAVNSVLAVPVFKPSDRDQQRPIGVLCVDSTAPGSLTAFQTEDVQAKVEAYAVELGVIL